MKICKNHNCQEPVYKEFDLCIRHYALDVWGENTGENNLGVLQFFKNAIPRAFKSFKYGTPFFFREILWELLQDKPDWKMIHRKIVIAAPRGSSKSTLVSKAFALYCALFARKKYIVIASKTSRMAEKNLRWIKNALGTKKIIYFFGDLRPDSRGKNLKVDTIDGKWTSSYVVLRNGVAIEALGIGQQVRSSAEGEDSDRIDLFIADDVETEENTRTPERRETNEAWLFDTVLPSLDLDTGQIVWIGTMQHTHCILRKLLLAPGWRKKFYQVTTVGTDGKEIPLWPEKFPISVINSIRDDYQSYGRLKGFYKEYYNIIISDEGFSQRWFRYWRGRVFWSNGSHWIEIDRGGGQPDVQPAYITMGVDLAFSEKTMADFTALVLMAETPERRKYVLPYKRARMTVYDDIDGGKLVRAGFISEIIRLLEKYPVDKIIVGVGGQQRGYYRLIKQKVQEMGYLTRVLAYEERLSKIDLIKDTLQDAYEAGEIYHFEGACTELEGELISLGNTTDDLANALAFCRLYSKTPKSSSYSPLFGAMNPFDEKTRRYIEPARKQSREVNWMTL